MPNARTPALALLPPLALLLPLALALLPSCAGAPPAASAPPDPLAQCQAGTLPACKQVIDADFGAFVRPEQKRRADAAIAKACDLDDAWSCRVLGEDLLGPITRGKDPRPAAQVERGLALLEKACARGDTVACVNGSIGMEHGWWGAPDEARARHMHELSCQGGDETGCDEAVARAADVGDGAKTTELCHALVCRKADDPCDELVGQKLYSRTRWDTHAARKELLFSAARAAFERACAAKQPFGCLNFGLMALLGEGGPVDAKAAAAALREPCEKDRRVCKDYGRASVASGDDGAATAAFARACEGGDKTPCEAAFGNALAAAHRFEDARPHLETACEGDAAACVDLGRVLVAMGRMSAGAKALSKACDAHVPAGCTRLAVMVAAGKGVPKDLARAKRLIARACDDGDREACPFESNPAALASAAGALASVTGAMALGVGGVLYQVFLRWPAIAALKVLGWMVGQ